MASFNNLSNPANNAAFKAVAKNLEKICNYFGYAASIEAAIRLGGDEMLLFVVGCDVAATAIAAHGDLMNDKIKNATGVDAKETLNEFYRIMDEETELKDDFRFEAQNAAVKPRRAELGVFYVGDVIASEIVDISGVDITMRLVSLDGAYELGFVFDGDFNREEEPTAEYSEAFERYMEEYIRKYRGRY